MGPETPAEDARPYVTQHNIDVVGLSITLACNVPKAQECIESLKAIKNPPLVLMGGIAMQENTKEFPTCRVVADFTEAMNILDGVIGIPTGNQSLSQLFEGVGGNIQKTRLARGMNQRELVQRAGVDRAYISLVENGKQKLDDVRYG